MFDPFVLFKEAPDGKVLRAGKAMSATKDISKTNWIGAVAYDGLRGKPISSRGTRVHVLVVRIRIARLGLGTKAKQKQNKKSSRPSSALQEVDLLPRTESDLRSHNAKRHLKRALEIKPITIMRKFESSDEHRRTKRQNAFISFRWTRRLLREIRISAVVHPSAFCLNLHARNLHSASPRQPHDCPPTNSAGWRSALVVNSGTS